MNHRCANPACDSEYDYFRSLKLRALPLRSSDAMTLMWLCDECCVALKLDKKGLPRMQVRRPSCSSQPVGVLG
jgi:hypothetical protein